MAAVATHDPELRVPAFFSHEYGRRVGGVPRSSLKGKETHKMMGDRTQETKNPKNTKPKQQTKPQPNNTKGQRPIPHHSNSVSSVWR